MAIAIDPDYEGWAGIERIRKCFNGVCWVTLRTWDIGRAKRSIYGEETEAPIVSPKKRGVTGGRKKAEMTLFVYSYMLEHGPSTATKISAAINLDAEKVQNMFQRNADLFAKLARGQYGARRIPG